MYPEFMTEEDIFGRKRSRDSIIVEIQAISERNIEWENIEKPLNIVIRGRYVWISGETKEVRRELKDLGLRWASKKMEWFWKPPTISGAKWGRKRGEEDIDKIENKYGSVVVQGDYKPGTSGILPS